MACRGSEKADTVKKETKNRKKRKQIIVKFVMNLNAKWKQFSSIPALNSLTAAAERSEKVIYFSL